MIFKKLLFMMAAVAAMATAAVVCVIAIAFALYAALRDVIGPAWASAAVAATAAVLAVILALIVTRKARPRPARGDDQNLAARLIELARERPLVAVGAMAAAVTVVIRNPRILTAIAAALFASRKPPQR